MFEKFIDNVRDEYRTKFYDMRIGSRGIHKCFHDMNQLLNQSVKKLALQLSTAILSGKVPLYCETHKHKCELYCGKEAKIVKSSSYDYDGEFFMVYVDHKNVSQLVSRSFIGNEDPVDVRRTWYQRWLYIIHTVLYPKYSRNFYSLTRSLNYDFGIMMSYIMEPVIANYLKEGKMLEVVEDIFANIRCEYMLCELNAASTLPKMLGLGNVHSDQHLNIDQCLFYLKGLQRQLSVYIPKYVNELVTNHYITKENMLRCRCVFYPPKSGQTSASQAETKSEDTTLMSRCDI